jgi:hypothetical protein
MMLSYEKMIHEPETFVFWQDTDVKKTLNYRNDY